jgi:epoxyqueuosine reductase
MKILLHSCCAPCTIYPLESLRREGFQPTAYFFNPNIHPFREFKRRLTTMRDYANTADLPLLLDKKYGLTEFVRTVVFNETIRCTLCYTMRLEQTAQVARQENFSAFSSSLLYSRYQKHDLLRDIGEEISKKVGIAFIYRDFREGWQYGIDQAAVAELYRQPYCGCIYSEQERYDKSLAPPSRQKRSL